MSKKGSRNTKDYVVGKGRPPQSTQFEPGQSGNPKGRPKGTKNIITYLLEDLSTKIDIRQLGEVRKVSKREAMAINYNNLALKGDHKVLPMIINLDCDPRAVRERQKLRAIREDKTPMTDREALEAYRRTLRGEDD
jgi:Family of unknown function (DUF5681)